MQYAHNMKGENLSTIFVHRRASYKDLKQSFVGGFVLAIALSIIWTQFYVVKTNILLSAIERRC